MLQRPRYLPADSWWCGFLNVVVIVMGGGGVRSNFVIKIYSSALWRGLWKDNKVWELNSINENANEFKYVFSSQWISITIWSELYGAAETPQFDLSSFAHIANIFIA